MYCIKLKLNDFKIFIMVINNIFLIKFFKIINNFKKYWLFILFFVVMEVDIVL